MMEYFENFRQYQLLGGRLRMKHIVPLPYQISFIVNLIGNTLVHQPQKEAQREPEMEGPMKRLKPFATKSKLFILKSGET